MPKSGYTIEMQCPDNSCGPFVSSAEQTVSVGPAKSEGGFPWGSAALIGASLLGGVGGNAVRWLSSGGLSGGSGGGYGKGYGRGYVPYNPISVQIPHYTPTDFNESFVRTGLPFSIYELHHSSKKS